MTHSEQRLATIGRILLEARKLTPEQVDTISRYQSEHGGKFGEVAVKLRLLSEADLHAALARQFSFPLTDGSAGLSALLVAGTDPYNPDLESLRNLRTHLLLNWLDASNRCLLVVETQRGDGASFVLGNLAILFSQMGLRTLLIDADLREPALQQHFSQCVGRPGLADVLAGRAGSETVCAIDGLPDLFVMPAGTQAPNPQELLGGARLMELLAQVRERFELVLINAAPSADNADAQLLASRCDGAVVSVRRNRSRMREVAAVQAMLATVACPVQGVVLND